MRAILQQVEANAEHLTHLRHTMQEQHREFMEEFRRLTEISSAHLKIAQSYQELIGNPLQRGRYALGVLRTVFAWTAGILLTWWGLKEIFDSFFIPRGKS